MNSLNELWHDIKGYEDRYVISSHGRVYSKPRIEKDKNGRCVYHKGGFLKLQPNSQGYMRVQLKCNGDSRYHFVHRLVALHFVKNPSPDEYNVVNHLDGDHLNNKAYNLEWTNIYGNNHHAINNGRMKRTEKWLHNLRVSKENNGKTVIGTNIATGEIIRFICLNDCKSAGFQPSCVCNCCQGKRKQHKGFAWRYE